MSRRSRGHCSISTLVCQDCGSKFPVPRRKGQDRERGHVKHLWCVVCKKRTAHTEIREFDNDYKEAPTLAA